MKKARRVGVFHEPLTEARVVFVKDDDSKYALDVVRRRVKSNVDTSSVSDDCHGFTAGDGRCVVMYIRNGSDETTCYHEILHVVQCIMIAKGMDDDEVAAYMLESIIRKWWGFIGE